MTLSDIFAVIMVTFGAIFMLCSIILALKMLSSLRANYRKKWILLIVFKGFFLLGYLTFIIVSVIDLPLPIELITGAVFMGGGGFVLLIIRLTKLTVTDLKDHEKTVQALNESLEDKVRQRTSALQESMKELAVEVEDRIKATKETLQMSEELQLILNTISTGIRVINENYQVEKVNDKFCQLTGLSSDELIGNHCYENFADEECRKSKNCPLHTLQERLETSTITATKNTKDGREIHFRITAAPLKNADDNVIGIVEDFHDITPLINAQKETELAQSRLHQAAKLESVGQLAAGIAHEINTPVQFIGTNIEFFKESFEDMAKVLEHVDQGKSAEELSRDLEEADWEFLQEEIPDALTQTQEGVERVRQLVLAMKEFSHPGTREMAPTDINAILKNTITISQNEWKMVADINQDLAEELPMPPCKSDEMGQVFLNIIVNAAHAIADNPPADGSKGTITIRTTADEQHVIVEIRDSGTGMSEEIRSRIFEPFFTTKEVGSGSGQGLAIAHDIVTNKHNGEITVESIVGKGTAFFIRLPISEVTSD